LADIEGRLRDYSIQRRRRADPVIDSMLAEVVDVLEAADHFHDEVREDFTDVLDLTLRFLQSRYNIEPSRAGRYAAYLFRDPDGEGPAPEEDLAIDYHEHLQMYASAGRARYEVRGIGSGRVDVLMEFGTHEFSAEVKRELADASWGALEHYLSQAGVYAGAGVRMGLLLVLDQTLKPEGPEALEALVRVAVVNPVTVDDLARHIVIVKIPGRRVAPSALSWKRSRSTGRNRGRPPAEEPSIG
jgi:hypothetical protein